MFTFVSTSNGHQGADDNIYKLFSHCKNIVQFHACVFPAIKDGRNNFMVNLCNYLQTKFSVRINNIVFIDRL